MVRVWFGDESQGLRRDRNEFVLTVHRACSDIESAKTFYCDALDFKVVGLTRNASGRQVFIAHNNLPSFSLCLTESDKPSDPVSAFLLDIGIWNESEWQTYRTKLGILGFEVHAEKLANPFQMSSDYADPDGYPVRLTYTRPPVNTGKGLPE